MTNDPAGSPLTRRQWRSRFPLRPLPCPPGLLPVGAPAMYSTSKAANIQFTRAIASALDAKSSSSRVYALCPSYTATALGPDPALIKMALGGVLLASHQAEGFMALASGELPNGSVMRVTARRRGKMVVHDLVTYGKELGGAEPPRPGVTRGVETDESPLC